MATNGKAWAHGSATHAARVLRNAAAGFMGLPWGTHANSATATTRGGGYGVVGDGDLLVTTTGSLGYSVAAGRVLGPGTFAAAQGLYTGYNDAAVTGSVGARHATLTRIDYICWRVRDTDEDASGAEDDGIVVVAGTAGSGAPSVPSSLGTLVVLSEVTVPSSAAGTALTFTDRRTKAAALGGCIPCTSSTRPTGIALRNGQLIYESDTGDVLVYNTAAVSWQSVLGNVKTYTPGWNGSIGNPTIGNGTLTGRYTITGRTMQLVISTVPGTVGYSGGAGTWTWSLPPGYTSVASVEQIGTAKIYDPNTTLGDWVGLSYIGPGATSVSTIFPVNATTNVHQNGRNADASSAAGTGIPNVGAAYPLMNPGSLLIDITLLV